MKNPTYAQFMNEVEKIISHLSKDELKNNIIQLAQNQKIPERNNFLKVLIKGHSEDSFSLKEKAVPQISPEKFILRIKNFEQRILDGEFYDEEENMLAWSAEEHSYWDRHDSYYDEGIAFSHKPYVLEAIELLEESKGFFRKKDIETAFEAYELLFDIFEHPDNYEEECFVYGFSFKSVIDSEIYNEHKTIYLRCLYLELIKTKKYAAIYSFLTNEKTILLSDIIEIDRSPLPELDNVIADLIERLKPSPIHDKLLVDILFVKGGIEEIKSFAYANGEKHPPIFLYYYHCMKEQQCPDAELLQIILDGITIIPQRFQTRSILGLDLIGLAKKTHNKGHLALGYSTAFYSSPTLENLTYFLEFILSEQEDSRYKKLKKYVLEKNIEKSGPYNCYSNNYYSVLDEIYALNTYTITNHTVIIGRYILAGPETISDTIKPGSYLGFSSELKHIPCGASLILKSISQSHNAVIIDKLIDHYCCSEIKEERIVLKKLISDKANSIPPPGIYLDQALQTIEIFAVEYHIY